MNIEELKNNLEKIESIIEKYEEEMDKDGSRFNIFSILNLSSNEVRLHSNFIAELLNKKGTHSFGNEFCKLFLMELKSIIESNIIEIFNIDNYTVEVEKYAGLINHDYTSGGRIDIVISDNSNQRITIENKIFAVDQKNQLLRYYNYDKKALLLYLTLNVREPSAYSTNGEIHKNKEFYCITYKDFISKWLVKCIELSQNKPKVSETISQYLQIIKNYTQQNEKNKMNNEIINLIAENKELYNSIEVINESYHLFRKSVNEKFWNEINLKKPSETICKTDTGIDLKFFIDEDEDGFYFGFYLEKNSEKIDGTSESVLDLVKKIKEIDPFFQNNETYIGWIHSNVLRKFWCLDNEKIFDLNNEKVMGEFTDEIINDLNHYINEIKKRIDHIQT